MSDRHASPRARLAAPAVAGTKPAVKDADREPLWVDLGCGDGKLEGFVGIDRFALPGVDIICDLDHGIPLSADSVDYLLASHSLEHLRDLPATVAEIHRVCKDRARVTIIAPYEATLLNRANPYHLQAWNEHTARFFTKEASSILDPAQFSFPAISEWGLSATDHSRTDVDLRCVGMEFHYFPAYRGLGEETKRTLRHSLSDVCDQMAVHLLVVKSPITQDELSDHARRDQYPLPPAFEARRRAETDVSEQNLFSEIARMPARVAALSRKADEDIGLLGGEIRRFVQRIDHIDRALVAETQETRRALSDLVTETQETRRALSDLVAAGRTLSERMTAINSALTRRIQETADELAGQLNPRITSVVEAQSAQVNFGEKVLQHLVAERRARVDRAFRPIRLLRRYRQRGLDLRAAIGGELARLWQGPEAPRSAAFRLQLGAFLEASRARVYPLTTFDSPLHAIEIGVAAIFPPSETSAIADFKLLDSRNDVLRAGVVNLDQSCATVPVALRFAPLPCEPGQPYVFKLIPRANVGRIGVQLFEWHRITRLLRRVPELRLAYRGEYC